MKLFLGVLAVIVAVTLARDVGSRVPAETVAMGVGMMLGIAATVPVSLAMRLVLSRSEARSLPPADAPRPQATQPPFPRLDSPAPAYFPSLVVIDPTRFDRLPVPHPPARVENVPLIGPQREFRVIGEEGD